MSKQDLKIDTTANFAKTAYAEKLSATNTNLYTHCVSVARLAEKIARKLFHDMRRDVLPQDVDDIIAAIVHSAILAEVINAQRTTFEQIADLTNVQVATMVATLSRDIRLVETKRDLEYRGRLSTSPLATQIVAVSRIICTAQELTKRLITEKLAIAPLARKILTQLDGDLLCVHAVSRYYVLRLYAHAARNLIVDANQTIKKLKSEARVAKAAAKMTVSIRNRQAAKLSSHNNDKVNNDTKPGRRSKR